MLRRLLVVIVGLFCAIAPAQASPPDAVGAHPHDLLQRSLRTSSAAERGIIRAHLATTYPATPEGMFGAAWIAGIEGRREDSLNLYRQTIHADPELTVAYINLGSALEAAGKAQAALDVYDTALRTAPFDVDLIRNGFFLRQKMNGDKAEALRFLDEWQGKVGDLDYGFDFVRGLDAEADGNVAEAERLYQSAIAKDAPFEVYEKLATLRLNGLSDDKTPPAARIAYVSQVLEPLLQDDGDADAYLFVGRMLRDRLGAGRYAIDYFSRAFDITPTAEAAEEAFTQMAAYDFAAAREFLVKAGSILPDNYALKNSLAWMSYQFLADPDRAGELALEALALAPHDTARLSAILSFGLSRQAYGRFEEAHAFYEDKLTERWPSGIRRKLLRAAAENSIAAQDFARAKTHLDAIAASGDPADTWLAHKTALVGRALTLQAKQNEDNDAPSPAVPDILFDLNSDVISAGGRDALKRLAQGLSPQAPVLSIEGYADSTGSFAVNEALSYRRAKAVRDYLVHTCGVAPDRLRIAPHGSRFPAASNRTHAGRRENRRVEIWPISTDALSSRPPALKGSAFSPDGRHVVFGQSPPQVWDIRTDTARATLHRGRSHRFSPDGRYIAAISSYREESGETNEAVYVYHAASGRSVAQIHEPLEVVELAWRPDSAAIAFATADGFLKTYDLATRGYKVTRMGPVRIGGPLVWLPDGRTIAGGQHRMDEITLWDAETLRPLRVLGGVDWPHAIGASPDGRHLLAFDNRMTMSVWDLPSGDPPRQMQVPMIPLDLQFHPTRPDVVFNAKFEASDVSLAVVDFRQMRNVAQWTAGGTFALGLSRDGETVTAISGSRNMVLDAASLQISPKRSSR
jgi:outer membrane protein OmpA-like peptidoglycan-associated protein